MKNCGFTLIELMIVVAIIALIAAIAIPSMLRSRMAANEVSAVASLKTYSQSQEIFHRTDWDRDGVLEYSQRIGGSAIAPPMLPNLIDRDAVNDSQVTLVDRSLAEAEGEPNIATQKAGYVFVILTTHGPAVTTYLLANSGGGGGTSMILGHALSAVPNTYDVSGISSYMLDHTGVIYLKDRGAQLPHETNYDPDPTWAVNQ